MWKFLYEALVQALANLKWSSFLATNRENSEMARRMRTVFQTEIYTYSGYICLGITLLATLLYYFVVNRKGGSGYWFKNQYWAYALLLNVLIILALTMWVSSSLTSSYSILHPFKYTLAIAITNAMYAAVFFVLFSIIFKRGSVANTTPF
jgi:hypothetical protein